MALFSGEGVVIKRRDFGEADRLVTIFTKAKGKTTFLAKGIRKVSSRRSSNLELLNQVKFSAHQGKSLPILTEAYAGEIFANLKNSLEKISLAYLMIELVDNLFEEEVDNQSIYDSISTSLQALNEAESLQSAKMVVASFQIKALRTAGFLPELYDCVKCKQTLKPDNNYLTPDLGGVVDSNCKTDTFLTRSLDTNIIKTLRFLEKESVGLGQKLRLSNEQISEVCETLHFYTQYVLEKSLMSRDFAFMVAKLPS